MPQGMRFVIPVALCLSVSAEVSLFKGMKRDELLGIRTADFMRDEFRYLNVSRVGTAIVSGPLDCGHACLENAACFSFNVGASGAFDSGKLQCELLATHKYNASEQLKENQMFHHYSIYVSGHGFVLCRTWTRVWRLCEHSCLFSCVLHMQYLMFSLRTFGALFVLFILSKISLAEYRRSTSLTTNNGWTAEG